MAKGSVTRFALLGLLNFGPASGYEIKKICDHSIAHFWNENYGHIYPMLKELADEGLVTPHNETQTGHPPRTVYKITAAGKGKLREWVEQPVARTPPRVEILLKFVFSDNIPRSKTIALLEGEIHSARETAATFAAVEEELKSHADDPAGANAPLWLASVDYGKRYIRMHIKWCEDQIRSLRETEDRERNPT
ncbi:MAG: PadR family transcriptional regulator [Rectinemataceae bacterium]